MPRLKFNLDPTKLLQKCRVCVKRCGIVNIFKKKIMDMLQKCVPAMECSVDDGLPDKICLNCLKDLSTAYRFQCQCVKSHSKLSEIFNHIPNKLLNCVDSNDGNILKDEVLNEEANTVNVKDELHIDTNKYVEDGAINIGSTKPNRKVIKICEILNQESKNLTVIDEKYPIYVSDFVKEDINQLKSTESNEENVNHYEILKEDSNDISIKYEKFDIDINNKWVTKMDKKIEQRTELHTSQIMVESSELIQDKSCNLEIIISKLNSLEGMNITPANIEKDKEKRIGITLQSSKKKVVKSQINNSEYVQLMHKNYNEILQSKTDMHADNELQRLETDNSDNVYENDDGWIDGSAKNYNCYLCNEIFTTNNHLKKHCAVHKDEIEECNICKKTSKGRYAITQHRATHYQYPCEHCGKMFSKINLHRHMLHLHAEFSRKCPKCYKTFTNYARYNTHLAGHRKRNKLQCDICEKSFTTRYAIQHHLNLHYEKKPYKCSYCEKKFTIAKNKFEHECLHTGARPYKCPLCDKTFIQKSNMKSHFLHKHKKDDYNDYRAKIKKFGHLEPGCSTVFTS